MPDLTTRLPLSSRAGTCEVDCSRSARRAAATVERARRAASTTRAAGKETHRDSAAIEEAFRARAERHAKAGEIHRDGAAHLANRFLLVGKGHRRLVLHWLKHEVCRGREHDGADRLGPVSSKFRAAFC